VLISSTFYTQVLYTKDNWATFSSFILALAKGFWQKSTFVQKRFAYNVDEIGIYFHKHNFDRGN
jgi:hypothetical protein